VWVVSVMERAVRLGSSVPAPDYVTPKQAAAYVGMSVYWFRQKLRDGKGPPAKRRGRIYLILFDDLVRWDQQTIIP